MKDQTSLSLAISSLISFYLSEFSEGIVHIRVILCTGFKKLDGIQRISHLFTILPRHFANVLEIFLIT